ncbi:PAS domain-containing protein [Bradyrhizobium ottawaense]|uniref:PAS domain-containing protein n=1 Tax=Bradyrhizobium ottawaense TaxID=931866 RepID=A0ABV4FK70_9BRAD
MSNVEEFPLSARRQPTEFEALVAAGQAALDAIPGAVYLCDAKGLLVAYNTEARAIVGKDPQPCQKGTLLRFAPTLPSRRKSAGP